VGGRALLVYRERSASWAGSERVLAYMVKVLRELGYFTTVLTFDGEWGNGFEKPDVLRGVPGLMEVRIGVYSGLLRGFIHSPMNATLGLGAGSTWLLMPPTMTLGVGLT